MLTHIRNITDETSTADPTDAMITNFINYRYQDLVGRIMNVREDYFGTTDATLDTVADQEEYTLPVDSNSRNKVKEIKKIEIAYDGSNYNIAYPIDLNEKYSTESDTNAAYTQNNPRYYIFGNKIGFSPIPDSSQTNNIKIWYIPRPDDLSTGTDIPILPDEYHKLIAYGAAADLRKRDDNFRAAQNYEKDYETGARQMVIEVKQRQIQWPNCVKDVADIPFRTSEDYANEGSLS